MSISRSRLAFAFIAFALAACSSAPPDSPLQGEVNPTNTSKKRNTNTSNTNNDDSEGQELNSGTTDDPAAPADPAADPAAPGTPAPTNGQCSAQPSFDACFSCCDQAFPGGFEVDANAFGQCACESPGVCVSVCAGNYCAGGQATPACEQCLATATQCNTAAETACNANASCKGVFTCVDSSGCEAKP